MFQAVIDHLWQSTLIVILAWLATLALRRHGAHLRYWIWFAASMKFLVPFALLAQLGAQIPWPESLSVSPQSDWPTLAVRVLQPASALDGAGGGDEFLAAGSAAASTGPAPAPSLASQVLRPADSAADSGAAANNAIAATTDATAAASSTAGVSPSSDGPSLAAIFVGVWLLGSFLLIARWALSWLTLRGLLRKATPISIDTVDRNAPPLRACASILEPGIFGIFKPVLLIPHELVRRLTRDQLRAIVRHERIHADRRDNLTAAGHMLVEAVFWFHPFVWWIGARLVDERERACDEAVLASGVDPDVYASGLIQVCDFYLESPLLCAAGVGGGSLEDRVKRIADNSPLPVLGPLGRASLVAAPAVLCLVPLAIGLLEVPSARAQEASAQAGDLLQCVNPEVVATLLFPPALPGESVFSTGIPEEMAGITLPAEFTYIGSQTRNLDISSSPFSNPYLATLTYKTALASDAALAATAAGIPASDWRKGAEQRPTPGSSPVAASVYCRADRSLSVGARELDGTTYVSYGFIRGAVPTACEPRTRDPYAADAVPGSQYLPTLDFPPDPVTGVAAAFNGGTFDGRETRIEVRHNASLRELNTALTRKLVGQGWASDASWTGTTTAGSSWSKQFDDGARVQATLELTQTGETAYTASFRLVPLQ